MADTLGAPQPQLSLKRQHLLGIICLAVAMFVFVSANALLKTIEQSYPIIEVVFFRNFFAIIPCIVIFFLKGSLPLLKVKNLPIHCLRAVFGVASLCCLFQSILLLSLAEATVFMFTSSVFVTALAFPMLRERVGLSKWGAVIVGFVGVLIIARPTQNVFNWGVVFGVISAFIEAVIMVHNRKLAAVNHPLAIALYYLVVASIISGCFLPFFWMMPTAYDFLIFMALGLGGGIGQYLVTAAYAYAPAGLLSPILYTALIWSLTYGFLFFQEVPNMALIIGGGLIIMANLFVIFQENKKISKETV